MSWSTEADRRLRHSALGRLQPWIRQQAPWLHAALLRARDVLLPFRSRHGLSRYQHRAIERFLSFGPALDAVLEVGSDLDRRVMRELADRGARSVVGVNPDVDHGSAPASGDAGHGRFAIVRADARRLPFADGCFSAVFTVAAFEHIHDLDRALGELHRVLRPGGIVYSDFGPIWSCSVGHHVYAIVDGVEARHWKPGRNPVPHFAHLLMTPEQLRPRLFEKSWMFDRLADAVIEWIYRGAGINRLFYEDYERLFRESPFEVVHLEPVREHVGSSERRELQRRHPLYRDFDVRMVEVALRKPR
jgi:SAM-dependent methyltransferase